MALSGLPPWEVHPSAAPEGGRVAGEDVEEVEPLQRRQGQRREGRQVAGEPLAVADDDGAMCRQGQRTADSACNAVLMPPITASSPRALRGG